MLPKRNKTRMIPSISISVQLCNRVPNHYNKAEKERKYINERE